MSQKNFAKKENLIIQWSVVIFWTLFWFFNVIDKFIGGNTYLFVGKDRLAQFTKFFSSLDVQSTFPAIGSLALGTFLEIAAFIFLAVAIVFLFIKDHQGAKRMFFWGSMTGMGMFTFFAIGDQIFGDRFELLEHSLFWLAILLSWHVYNEVSPDAKGIFHKKNRSPYSKTIAPVIITIVVIGLIGAGVLTKYSVQALKSSPSFVLPTQVTAGVYKFDIPFLMRRGGFEQSLEVFIGDHPDLKIRDIYTAPDQLKSKADNAVIYVVTE